MATFRFTLLLYLSLALAVAASANPNTVGHHRRDHGDLARLVKKRSPLDLLGNQPAPQGQQASIGGFAIEPSQQASGAAQTTPANSASGQATPSSSAFAPASSSTGGDNLLSSLLGGVGPSSSGSASSTVHTTSSTTSSSSSATPASTHASDTPATTPSQSILYITSNSIPTPTQTSATSSSTGMSHAALTVLVIIAASVGASVIVWTIIRKWKFRPSSDFGSRMQPIDWQPGGNDDAGPPGQHRPLSRASSFHSGSANAHVDDHMRGPVGGYGTAALNPIPDHDFTAGPAHLAPVGGYADLARGPSPQPMMQESLGRAPTINRPMQYDQQGVPLYHGYTGY